MEILQVWMRSTGPFMCAQPFEADPETQSPGSVPELVAELVSALALPYLYHKNELSPLLRLGHPMLSLTGGRVRSSAFMPFGMTTPLPPAPAPLGCLGKSQGKLSLKCYCL